MCGRQHQAASRAEFFEQRYRQRCALLGSSARAHFVQQHQRTRREYSQNRFEIQHVRRKCRKVRGDGLFIADIGEHAVEYPESRRVRRHGNARLRRQHRKADRLQRYRLAAGVWAADDQHGIAFA